MQRLNFATDKKSTPVDFQALPASAYSAEIAADTDTTLTVPTGANYAQIELEPGASCYVSDSEITIPSGSSFSESNQLFICSGRRGLILNDVETLHFRASLATRINVVFWR